MSLQHRVTPDLIERVKNRPAFRAFTALLGERIQRGNATDAFRMLEGIGANGAMANEIIEGWPIRDVPHPLDAAGMTHGEIAALYLACYVDDIANYDWPALLLRSCNVAHAKRQADQDPESPQAGAAGDPMVGP